MSLELDRRSFLVGLFGVAATTLAPLPKAIETVDLTAWAKAVSEVYGRFVSDAMIYGTAAIRTCETFPYVRNIDPAEMTMDELKQAPLNTFTGLFDDFSPARKAVSDAIGNRSIERAFAEQKAR